MMDSGPTGRDKSIAAGKAARGRVPLGSHRDFEPGPGRDPVALLLEQAESRVPELVPVRHGRMLVSPFTFFRGAALPMAARPGAHPRFGFPRAAVRLMQAASDIFLGWQRTTVPDGDRTDAITPRSPGPSPPAGRRRRPASDAAIRPARGRWRAG
jgi:hypothetical protein